MFGTVIVMVSGRIGLSSDSRTPLSRTIWAPLWQCRPYGPLSDLTDHSDHYQWDTNAASRAG